MNKSINRVDVPISEYDLELFKDLVEYNEEFDWNFTDINGKSIRINFINTEVILLSGLFIDVFFFRLFSNYLLFFTIIVDCRSILSSNISPLLIKSNSGITCELLW